MLMSYSLLIVILLIVTVVLAAASVTFHCNETGQTRFVFCKYGCLYADGKGVDRDIVTELEWRTGVQFGCAAVTCCRVLCGVRRDGR